MSNTSHLDNRLGFQKSDHQSSAFNKDTLIKERGNSESSQTSIVEHWDSQLFGNTNNYASLGTGSYTPRSGAVMETALTIQVGSSGAVEPPNERQVLNDVEVQSPEIISLNNSQKFVVSPSRAGTPIQSSSRFHWNQIRNAIIPGVQGHNRSGTESTISTVDTVSITRPQTPRQFKFPRRGFRHVAEATRDLLQEELSRFETSIYQACYKARFGELRGRLEKETQLGYLPFMSSGSISVPNSASSQPLKPSNETYGRTKPSVSQLHHTLVRYASNTRSIDSLSRLPYEAEVLSVLSIPFISDDVESTEEQWIAIESFEIAVGSWQASSKQREVDRILWCCKTALIPASPVRSRIVATLSTLIYSSKPFDGDGAIVPAFQNILHGLQSLLYKISQDPQPSPPSSGDSSIVRDLITHVNNGHCGDLRKDIIEEEYGVQWSHGDTQESIRMHIVAETLTRSMENDTDGFRRWFLSEIYEIFWEPTKHSSTPLSKKITLQKLGHFLRAVVALLRPNDDELMDKRIFESDCMRLFPFIQNGLLNEICMLPPPSSVVDHCTLAVELLLQCLSTQRVDNRQVVTEIICRWCARGNKHRDAFFVGLRLLTDSLNWQYLSSLVFSITGSFSEEERDEMLAVIIPTIYSRLVAQADGNLFPKAARLLSSLVEISPRLFYKPIFALAGASKDTTLLNQLANVVTMAKIIPQFWISDSEMIAVALMSDPHSPSKSSRNQQLLWSRIRLGQSLILLELIVCIRELIKNKRDPYQPPDNSQSGALRFVTGLETRLAILIEAKEKIALIPMSQRILISILFLDIRLFTRSLKPIPWLSTIISWATQSFIGASLKSTSEVVSRGALNEILESFEKMQNIYKMCFENPSTKRISTVAQQSHVPVTSLVQTGSELVEEALYRIQIMGSLPNVSTATLRLLVAVYALMTPDDHRILYPVLWKQFLDESEIQVIESSSFLLTLALEKLSQEVGGFIRSELTSPDAAIKRVAIRRITTLFGWRSQLLNQVYLFDKIRRRPFMFAREPIAFVSVDAGSGVYVAGSSDEESTTAAGVSLPSDLRKRLAEIGWDDKVRPKDSRREKERTPLSILSLNQITEQSNLSKENIVKSENETSLLRRKSSSDSAHHSGHRRRSVFVPALVALFAGLSQLTTEPDPFVAGSAREAVHLMLRDDPSMICRPLMEDLSSNEIQIERVISTLRYLLHVHRSLPPSASHHMFGYLSGFLKHISREQYHSDGLQMFAYTVPVLATLVSQVYNLSVRDIRRTKMEIFVLPLGSMWFPSTAPDTPMFPRYLPVEQRGKGFPRQLEHICMIRTAQNLFLLDMLKYKSKELHIARRRLMDLKLPDDPIGSELKFSDFLPRRTAQPLRTQFQQVSLALSRTYLLLLSQIFRAMPRNFNSRSELKNLFGGLNRVLLAHGNDIGIIAHALIACMIAMARFKRLVAAGGGFSMFIPSLVKVYAEAQQHPGIQYAIQYASSRFYAVHEENYLYQSLDTVSKLLVLLNNPEDKDWFAGRMSEFFSALKTNPRSTYDVAGIFNINKPEERELLIASTVVDDLPLTTITPGPASGEQIKKILLTGQFENKLLRSDDLVKLCLTVIAYNPTVTRAYNFLALLRRMVPYFYEESKSSRDVLREGIGALGQALFPKASRQKIPESFQTRQVNQTLPDDIPNDVKNIFEDNLTPCDEVAMRREYLELVVAHVRVAQDLRPNTMKLVLDLLAALLKESARLEAGFESTLLKDLAHNSFAQSTVNQKFAFSLLRELAPIIRIFALTTDCSGVIDSITTLLKRPEFGRSNDFVEFITREITSPLLEISEDAASENLLFALPMRSSIVSLLVQTASLESSDVASILEERRPSPGFLSGIVLPFCMMVKTTVEIETESQFKNQARALKHGATFVRIIAYVIEACQIKPDPDAGKTSSTQSIIRKNSQRSKHPGLAIRVAWATKIISVQIIKVLVLRATADISIGLKGIWGRMSYFLKDLLSDGNAKFALYKSSSPLHSPYLSPQVSSSPGGPFSRQSVSMERPSIPRTKRPRVVDYLTWSFLEFLCRSPSPLNLQMRLWMQEKIHDLDNHLKVLDMPGMLYPRHSRRVSSIFVRPRGFSTSPDALRPSSSRISDVPNDLNLLASIPSDRGLRIHFTQTTPGSSPQRHLGSPGMTPPVRDDKSAELSGSLFSHRTLSNNDTLKSPKLVAIVFDRIRFVQVYMGYDRLLPVEGQTDDADGIKFKPWTISSALLTMAEEMKLLMNEFPECFFENLGGEFVDVEDENEVLREP